MNAQTEQLIYWKQQYDLIRQERDDITRLCAEQEQRLEKAVEALRQVLIEATEFEKEPLSGACVELVKSALAAIEEPTDAN